MDECRSKSIGLLDRLRAGIQKVLPESDVLFDAAGTSTVDEDFFKAANAPMLVVGGGAFGAAAAPAPARLGHLRLPDGERRVRRAGRLPPTMGQSAPGSAQRRSRFISDRTSLWATCFRQFL